MDDAQYLRDEGLVIDEPYKQQNLQDLKRIIDKPPSVSLVNNYVVREEKIFCHICGGYRHNKGITGLLPNGTKLLFGSHCAVEFFGKQVWNQSVSEFRRREDDAFKRFRHRHIRNSIADAQAWITRYEHALAQTELAWRRISIAHSEALCEITSHLERNNGRVIEQAEELISEDLRSAGHHERFFKTEIITAVRSHQGINTIRELSQNITIVSHFISAILSSEMSERSAGTDQALDKYISVVLPAAKAIDSAAEFAADFFSESKLKVIFDWSDRQRVRRLSDRPSISPRNLYELVRDKCGYGFERPQNSLTSQFPDSTTLRQSLSMSKAEAS